MTYAELDSVNMSEGIPVLFSYVSTVVPIFFPLLLFGIFIVFSLGSYYTQKNLTGRGDFLVSLAVAGFITSIIAYVLSLVPGVVNMFTIIVCVVTSMIFTLVLLLRDR